MSNTDFFQIAALKVFAELGQLIEEDDMRRDAPASLHRLKGTLERPLGQATLCAADDIKQSTILDLPTDILHIYYKCFISNFFRNLKYYL